MCRYVFSRSLAVSASRAPRAGTTVSTKAAKLEEAGSSGEFVTDRPGLHHLAFLVSDIEEVRAAEERVRALGAPLFHDGVVPHGEGATSGGIFFGDPDGIRLEIYAPSGADVAPAPTAAAPTCGFF